VSSGRKKRCVFVAMYYNGDSVECELLRWWFIVYFDIADQVYSLISSLPRLYASKINSK
jgi:hypothetical protein